MNLSIVRYTEAQAAIWDDCVKQSRNGTVFHTRQFLHYHPSDRFHDHSLIIYDGEVIVALLTAAEKDGMLISHPGASYGGLVLMKQIGVIETGKIVEQVMEYAKKQEYRGISFARIAPISLVQPYSEDQFYWLFQKGWSLEKVEMDGAIPLNSTTEEEFFSSVTGKCRNMIRQAKRANIEIKLSNDFATFWPLLENVLASRHASKPTHTREEIERLHALLPQSFRLLAAYRNGRMVGGIVLITINERALYTLYMAQEYEVQREHPMHLLLFEAMKLAKNEGKEMLHVGVSTEEGGKVANEGLFFFKESFGCKPVQRTSWSYYFQSSHSPSL